MFFHSLTFAGSEEVEHEAARQLPVPDSSASEPKKSIYSTRSEMLWSVTLNNVEFRKSRDFFARIFRGYKEEISWVLRGTWKQNVK